jgi:hypothetical protein
MPKTSKPSSNTESSHLDPDVISFPEARRAANYPIPPSALRQEIKLGTSDFAVAITAIGIAGAVAWRPDAVSVWFAVIPLAALVTNYVANGVYQILVAHQWWRCNDEKSATQPDKEA